MIKHVIYCLLLYAPWFLLLIHTWWINHPLSFEMVILAAGCCWTFVYWAFVMASLPLTVEIRAVWRLWASVRSLITRLTFTAGTKANNAFLGWKIIPYFSTSNNILWEREHEPTHVLVMIYLFSNFTSNIILRF